MALSENQPGEVPDDERLRLYIKVPPEKDEEEVKDHFKSMNPYLYYFSHLMRPIKRLFSYPFAMYEFSSSCHTFLSFSYDLLILVIAYRIIGLSSIRYPALSCSGRVADQGDNVLCPLSDQAKYRSVDKKSWSLVKGPRSLAQGS